MRKENYSIRVCYFIRKNIVPQQTYKTLFTLFLGILVFIPSFTANSLVNAASKSGFACVAQGNADDWFRVGVDTKWAKYCNQGYLLSKKDYPTQYKKLKKYFKE